MSRPEAWQRLPLNSGLIPAPRLVENGRQYIQLLRSHIQRENGVLFPMAEARMGAPDQAMLVEAFERFEAEETGAGVHERAVNLLAELTAAAL